MADSAQVGQIDLDEILTLHQEGFKLGLRARKEHPLQDERHSYNYFRKPFSKENYVKENEFGILEHISEVGAPANLRYFLIVNWIVNGINKKAEYFGNEELGELFYVERKTAPENPAQGHISFEK